MHHLVYEILNNVVGEAQAGYATEINAVLHDDNSVSVTDNGRGFCAAARCFNTLNMAISGPIGW